jgi:hypothetical protein
VKAGERLLLDGVEGKRCEPAIAVCDHRATTCDPRAADAKLPRGKRAGMGAEGADGARGICPGLAA